MRHELTLYTGAHRGAEATFRELATKWGLPTVAYSFEGNAIEGDASAVTLLSAEQLQKGDVSMEIVSRRLDRSYHSAERIRKVTQTLFHVVNNSYHVFVVGVIQPDQTVKGGTGWAVELARFFNREVSVYDQERKGWFTWRHGDWIPDLPSLGHKAFAGTGTRNLTDHGKAALEDLFQRSLG